MTARKPRTGKPAPPQLTPWKPGQSGNPAGVPSGSRHRICKLLDVMNDAEIEAINKKVILAAKGEAVMTPAELTAAKMVMDHYPPRRDRPITIKLPPIHSAEDAAAASATILAAVCAGEVSPQEGNQVGSLVETYLKSLEATDFSRRLKALEGRLVLAGEKPLERLDGAPKPHGLS
jgi:hypothetical protein